MPTQTGDLTKEEVLSAELIVRADTSSYYLEAEATIDGRGVSVQVDSAPRRGRRPAFRASVGSVAEALQGAYEDLPDEETEEPSAL